LNPPATLVFWYGSRSRLQFIKTDLPFFYRSWIICYEMHISMVGNTGIALGERIADKTQPGHDKPGQDHVDSLDQSDVKGRRIETYDDAAPPWYTVSMKLGLTI